MGNLSVTSVLNRMVENGLISVQQREIAERIAKEKSTSLRTINPIAILISQNIVSELETVEVFASILNIPVIRSVYDVSPTVEALNKISQSFAQRLTVLPVSYDKDNDELTVVTQAFTVKDANQLDNLRRVSKVNNIKYVTSTRQIIEQGIGMYYRAESEMERITQRSTEEVAARAEKESQSQKTEEQTIEVVEESPVVTFVNLVLQQAITDEASDIHLEPDEHIIRVRFRIDGVLHDVNEAPKHMAAEIISRIKIMSDLDIAKKNVPQDGRMSYNHKVRNQIRKMDLRVAVLPTVWGEKIVLRVLDSSSASLELKQLGFSPRNLERFERAYKKPYGMVLVTGPTGSGKSTTLYATLNTISTPELNVFTVEDPVEYRIPRINQMPVNPRTGLTFAKALRAILRGDPDIVLVGEVRDKETAQIAIEAGLTGHLVLSTLHTNDAASAISRLIEMGIEPFLVGSVIEAVLAQRLIRRLCNVCKEEYTPTNEELIIAGFPLTEDEKPPTLARAVGCPECANTGYKGRTGVHEVLIVDDQLEKLAVANATSSEIAEYAINEGGMHTLKDDGWYKALQHETSIEEILRVIA